MHVYMLPLRSSLMDPPWALMGRALMGRALMGRWFKAINISSAYIYIHMTYIHMYLCMYTCFP